MTEEKKDFLKWQSENLESLDEDTAKEAKSYIDSLRVLTFRIDNKKTNIVSTYKEQIVFVEKTSPYDVAAGETWVCSLRPSFTVLYAMPIVKITLSEALNYNEKLRENILSELWLKHRKEITSMFEGRLTEDFKAKITDDLNKNTSEEIMRLKSEIDRLTSELHETRFQLNCQGSTKPAPDEEYILLGTEDVVKTAKPIGHTVASEAVAQPTSEDIRPTGIQTGYSSQPMSQALKAVPQIKRVTAIPQKFEVERIGEDSLRSPSFTDHRYFAHMSPDYHTLVIRPNDEGNVYSLDGVIRLEGLGRLCPFTAKKFLPAEYSEIYEGMIVRL